MEKQINRRAFLKSAATTTAAGGLVLGSTRRASAACNRDRILTIRQFGDATVDYHFSVGGPCKPRPFNDTTENSDSVRSGATYFINGKISSGVDKYKFAGYIDNMHFTQLTGGNAHLSFTVDTSRKPWRGSWYNLVFYAEEASSGADMYLSTSTDVSKENDYPPNLEPNDGVDGQTIESHVNGGEDYFEGKGQITGGNIYPKVPDRKVGITPEDDF